MVSPQKISKRGPFLRVLSLGLRSVVTPMGLGGLPLVLASSFDPKGLEASKGYGIDEKNLVGTSKKEKV